MTIDHIRYDILTQDALRGVVRTVLEDAARNGLPGEHHFYIAFDTRADGVKLSQRMRAQYPEEMTVVLQHQFWDLVASDEQFEVGLSFGGVPERVVVPYAAIKSFVDPSVQFGVQFETLVATEDAEGEKAADAAEKPARPPAEHRPTSEVAPVPTPANPQAIDPAPANPPSAKKSPGKKPAAEQKAKDASDTPAGGAQVVSLDRFRKK
ncbi:MAG: Stringent starvation protein B [Xanthobacteraceae bacterium]|nr:Stringent starvation protein B [Xanthobacteraceae bacterium]